jgi:hypothetical protein
MRARLSASGERQSGVSREAHEKTIEISQMKRRLASLLSVIALASGLPVAAQDFSGVSSQYIDFGSSMMAVGQLNNVLGSTVRSGGSGGSGGSRASPARRHPLSRLARGHDPS